MELLPSKKNACPLLDVIEEIKRSDPLGSIKDTIHCHCKLKAPFDKPQRYFKLHGIQGLTWKILSRIEIANILSWILGYCGVTHILLWPLIFTQSSLVYCPFTMNSREERCVCVCVCVCVCDRVQKRDTEGERERKRDKGGSQ